MGHVVGIDIEVSDVAAPEAAAEQSRDLVAVRTTDYDWWGTWPDNYHGAEAAYRMGFDPVAYGTREFTLVPKDSPLGQAELEGAARDRLGSLFNPSDYPETLVGLFGVEWGFPAVEPPDYLVRLAPGLYEAERARVAARFEEAVQLAEQAFLDEFARLVSHLAGGISGVGEDGQPRVFRDSAVGNLVEFFDRFRSLDEGSSDQLDALVAEAQRAVRGVGARDLREGQGLRREVAARLSRVQTSLDAMMVARPRRRILRQSAGPGVRNVDPRRPRRPGPRDLLGGDRAGCPRPPEDRPGQLRRAGPGGPLVRRPPAGAGAGAGPLRTAVRGPGGRGRLAGGALAHAGCPPRRPAAHSDLPRRRWR
jgi:hypothetical protein